MNGRILETAAAHGLMIKPGDLSFNDMGLDFRVCLAETQDGQRWILRIPRRPDVAEGAKRESEVLKLLRLRLPVEVPEWKIFSRDLIAYPMLPGQPGLIFDPITHEISWHFDRGSSLYSCTLGAAIAALHAVDCDEARVAGMPSLTPKQLRRKWLEDLDQVEANFEVPEQRLASWRRWISDDSYWPDFTVPTHGDLYAGHVMVHPDGRVCGIIDWTEAKICDPAVDFVGHLRVFGEEELRKLLSTYCAAGGKIWPRIIEHCHLLNDAAAVTYALYSMKTGVSDHRVAAQEMLMTERAHN